MTTQEAIAARVSRRSYLSAPLTPAERARLQKRIEALSRVEGVRIELVEHGQKMFSRFGKSYGLFSGVHTFFAMIARADDPNAAEKLGFFGELLVLEATSLGLGTCWVGGTFDRDSCPCPLDANERLACVVTVGSCRAKEGMKEAVIHRFMRRGTKDLEEFYDSSVPVPAWFKEGLQSVRNAPSAFNEQPVRLSFINGEVSASVPDMMKHRDLDLGIAKAHFALMCNGRWTLGNGGAFHKTGRGQYSMELSKAIDRLLDTQLAQTAEI